MLVLNRITKELLDVAEISLPAFPQDAWVHAPDLSAVQGLPQRHWKCVDSSVLAMTAEERAAADLAVLDSMRDALVDTLWQAAYAYDTQFFSGGIYAKMLDLRQRGVADAAENEAWLLGMWSDYYGRKAVILGANDLATALAVSCDFSNHGNPPHTVLEMLQAAGI